MMSEETVLEEHQYDTCDHEPPGQCWGGCVRAFCISDRHTGDVAPVWPCREARKALGFVGSAADYWKAEDDAWMAWHQAHYNDDGSRRDDAHAAVSPSLGVQM